MELPFVTLDVFTKTPYKGNPLAVVTIPPNIDPKPTQDQKQKIAREFNLSETVFLHELDPDPESHPAGKADTRPRRIDIFIINAELPFAGHPTIGTAVHLLASTAVNTILTKAGPISIARLQPSHPDRAISALAHIPHDVHLHAATLDSLRASLAPSDLQPNPQVAPAELSAPIFSVVRGLNFALVRLPSLDLLSSVQVIPAVFSDQVLDEDWREGVIGRYYYVLTGNSTDEDGTPVVHIRSRMILDIMEDPATGSAACALSSYLSLHGSEKQSAPIQRYEITQGVEMDRESNILVEITTNGSAIKTVTLSGSAVQVMRGSVTI